MPFPPSPYNPQFLTSIERTVTKERLGRYLGATHQDVANALLLYEYNIALSEALYGLLHGLEVTVRNAVHHALTASYGSANWYDAAPLSAYWRDEVAKAKGRVGTTTPGKVIAELTFGFWVDLISKPNHNHLWMGKKLSTAFPNTMLRRDQIHQRLKIVQALRNRISHHEPILTSRNTLYTGYDFLTLAEFLECVEWVCVQAAHWIKTRFRYAEAQRILAAVNATGVSL
jgi:hypothetical protein